MHGTHCSSDVLYVCYVCDVMLALGSKNNVYSCQNTTVTTKNELCFIVLYRVTMQCCTCM